MHKRISVLILVVGLVLMAAKIYADSEPGLIPILLVVLGIGWYLIARVRTQPHQE